MNIIGKQYKENCVNKLKSDLNVRHESSESINVDNVTLYYEKMISTNIISMYVQEYTCIEYVIYFKQVFAFSFSRQQVISYETSRKDSAK
jgi:hypothetical protein